MTAGTTRRTASTRRASGWLAAMLVVVTAGCAGTDAAGSTVVSEPAAGGWTTWVLDDPGDIEVPPPPEPASAEAQAELDELVRLVDERTPELLEELERYDGPMAVEPWTRLALEYTGAQAKQVPLSSRNYALLHVAIHDAVVATWHAKDRYQRELPDTDDAAPAVDPAPGWSYPSEHAAIAGAASTMLAYVYPDSPSMRLQVMAEDVADARVVAGLSTRSDVEVGLDIGRQVADRVIAHAERDGSDVEWDGERPEGIGPGPEHWEPPPGSVALPDAPLAGAWDTWVVDDVTELRPPPPPEFGSDDFVAAAHDVYEVHESLTDEQRDIARFWEGAEGSALPGGVLLELTLDDLRERELSLPAATRAMAALAVALHDGAIAVWDAKYTYWNPRPENAIRDLGLDEDWTPEWPTPLFPAYPSGSAGYAGAAEGVLSTLFPDDAERYRERAEEQTISRVYAGIHWRYDDVSLDTGRRIGALVMEHVAGDEVEDNG